MDEESVWLARPVPWALTIATCVAAPLLLAAPIGLWLLPLPDGAPWPFASHAQMVVTTTAVAYLALVVPPFGVVWVRRRFGACALTSDSACFRVPWAGAAVAVARKRVRAWRVSSHGVLLDVVGRSRLASWACPLLVPVRDDEELGAVLRWLEAAPPGPVAGAVTGAWSWPAAVLGTCCLFPTGFALVVIRAFRRMFEETGIPIPFATDLVVGGATWGPATAGVVLVAGLWATTSPWRAAALGAGVTGAYFALCLVGLSLPNHAICECLLCG